MSKKTRKKSPKAPAGKAVRAKSGISASASAKAAPAKARKAVPKKSAKSASKQPDKTSAKASHKAASKPLKPSRRSELVVPAAPPRAAKLAGDRLSGAEAGMSGAGAGAATPRQLGLREGGKAPAFSLPRDGGDTVSLADFKGSKLVLFFYPRADTPGCTKEAIDFSRLSAAFAESQTAVLGVSADPPKAQEAFRDKHELATPLASDEQHDMLDAYGVWGEKSMYGKTFLGILRTTVLVGADGRVIRIWRNVRVDGHADEVLAAVRAQ